MHIKVNDTVVVIAGKDKYAIDKKGNKILKTGKVLKVYPKENRVLVEGVNMVKKHQKPTQQNQSGQIIEQEAPIHVSNVMLLDPKLNVPTRVKMVEKADKKGNVEKIRVSKKSGYEFK